MRQPDTSATPFVRILPLVLAGILISNALPQLQWWTTALPTLICGILAWALRNKQGATLYTAATVLLAAMTSTIITTTHDIIPKNEHVVATLQIDDTPHTSGRWTKATATIDQYRTTTDKQWHKSGEKVIARFDTTHNISIGDRLITTARTSPLGSEEYQSYADLMHRRGYSATLWVGVRDSVITLPNKAHTPRIAASKLQTSATNRLTRLQLSDTSAATAMAMTTGYKQNIPADLKEQYSLSGTSHLLAVSGLHVGIVALLINLLLSLLPLARYGHIVKNVIAIAVIWLYAFTTGLSPSVTRAAFMFSGAQLALASSRKGSSINILAGTATVMLLANPNNLYDISFQLSFAAVSGILAIHTPLYRFVRTRYKFINIIWATFTVGIAATIATAPLVSFYFGRLPIIGIFLNPIVLITAHAIVLFSLLWIIAPIGFLNGFFSATIGFFANIQNNIIAFSSTRSWASLALSLSAWQTILVYIMLAIFWYTLRYGLSSQEKKPQADER